jgi:hypothetical protein
MEKKKKKRTVILPKKIKILGKEIKIVEEEGMEDCGEFFLIARTIKIKKEMPDEMKLETFLHEIVHAILGVSGISDTLDSWGDSIEEGIVTAIENGLHEHITLKVIKHD